MDVRIKVGDDLIFIARWERERAPKTCDAFRGRLPFHGKLLQARWSGESAWIPLGDYQFGVELENATSAPAPGHILLYPAGISETEILFPYGQCAFASKAGPLEGNHFLTVTDGREQFAELGRRVLWEGAQSIVFDLTE